MLICFFSFTTSPQVDNGADPCRLAVSPLTLELCHCIRGTRNINSAQIGQGALFGEIARCNHATQIYCKVERI